MKYASMFALLIFIWLQFLLCKTQDLLCETYDENTHTLQVYCGNYEGIVPGNCPSMIYLVAASSVNQTKIGGCERDILCNSIKRYKNVHVLDISYSAYNYLDWLDLHESQLNVLNASHNELRELYQFPKSAPELTEIDLSYNRIWAIDASAFGKLDKLMKLHLSHNAIDSIKARAFCHAPNLEYIDLINNRIWKVPEIPETKHLKSLHLEMNPITVFDCNYMKIMSSVFVHLNWDYLMNFNGNENCNGKMLHVVRNSKFEGVFPIANGQHEIHCHNESFKSLDRFEAGPNSMLNVLDILDCFAPSVLAIDLSSNRVGLLNTNTLRRFRHLRHLSLSNTSLSGFDLKVLKSQKKLKSLDISNNNLKYIENVFVLWDFVYLIELNISGNRIGNTPQIIYTLRSSIVQLDVSGNFVGKLNATTLDHFRALKKLGFSNTSLSFPDRNPFERLPNLIILDISHNNLEHLNFAMIAPNLKRLSELYAADCHIKNATEIIQHLSLRLETLDLSYNQLPEVDFKLLSINLREVYLEGNDLTKLDLLTQSRFLSLDLVAIARNRFSCLFLKQLLRNEKTLTFVGEHWIQKPNIDCHSSVQGISEFLGGIYDKLKFW